MEDFLKMNNGSFDSVPATAIVSILASLSLILLIRKLFLYSGNKRLPGPRGLPIVGYLPFIRADPHRQFTELSSRYGPIYKLWIGSKLHVVIASPSIIKQVVRHHDTCFANRDVGAAARLASYGLNDVSWSPYGPTWANQKKLLKSSMMSNPSLEASGDLRRNFVREAVGALYFKSRTGTGTGTGSAIVDVYDFVFEMYVKLMIDLIWGPEIGDRNRILTGLLSVVPQLLDLVVKPNISDIFPVLARFDVQGIAREMSAALERFDAIVEDAIDQQLKINHQAKEGIKIIKDKLGGHCNHVLEAYADINNGDKKQIKAMIFNILACGPEVLGRVIEWAMAELLSNPKAMEKAQQELTQVVGLDNIVEEFHAPKLEFLDAILKETLRLHPLGPFLSRRTPSESCTVEGYTIPTGSAILLNVYAVQRDPMAWDDPMEFRPERFLGNAGKWDFLGTNFSYLPFGSGRRICPGIPLAERMNKYVLASLLHSFEWRLADGETMDMSDVMGLALRKATPLRATAVPRLSSSHLYK